MREYSGVRGRCALREQPAVREQLAACASGYRTVDVSGRNRRPPVESPELIAWPALKRVENTEHRPGTALAWTLRAACHDRRASSEVSSANRDAATLALTVSHARSRIFDSPVANSIVRPALFAATAFRRPSGFRGAIALATTERPAGSANQRSSSTDSTRLPSPARVIPWSPLRWRGPSGREDKSSRAGYLVPGYRGVGDLSPLAACEVDVRVTDPAELDVDPYVLRPERSTLDLQRTERAVRGERSDGASRGRLGSRCSQRGSCHANDGRSPQGLERGAVSPPLGFDRWTGGPRFETS